MLQLILLTDAAKDLGVAASTLRHQIRLGKLEARRVSDRWYVTPEEVARYRSENQRKGAA
jgi:predicted site-specific integrase-resolvase